MNLQAPNYSHKMRRSNAPFGKREILPFLTREQCVVEELEHAVGGLLRRGYVAFLDNRLCPSICIAKERVKIDDHIEAFRPELIQVLQSSPGVWSIQPPFAATDEIPIGDLDDAISYALMLLECWDRLGVSDHLKLARGEIEFIRSFFSGPQQ